MNMIHRSAGLRFMIYVSDHEPAYIHIFGDGEARIDILTGEVLSNRGLKRRDLANALRIVGERQTEFPAKWKERHG